MAGFFSDNPPPTQVGTEDAAESTIQEDAVTQGDTSSGFFQGSPEQTSTNDYTTHVGTIYTVGDGGLTQKNFTAEQSSKLSGVATSANNYILPFTDNSTNWDTAYGWGSHATAGYLTSVDASSINSASVTDGYVLTADGAGNAAWEASTGGSSGSGNAESLEFVDILGALGAGVSPDWNRNTFNTAIAAQACAITIVGTSIAVGTAEQENSNTWANRLKAYLQHKYPDVVFTFNNLALGGRSLNNYNNTSYVGSSDPSVDPATGYYVLANPDTWPSGSTVGQSWKDAAEATAPDLFIMAQGMNDRSYIYSYQAYLDQAINDALSWTKAPSIAIVSEMLPRAGSGGFDRINDIGNYLRWYAMYNSYGLIDVNRAWTAVRYNIDSLKSVAQRQTTIANWVKSGGASTLTANSLTNTSGTNAIIAKAGDYAGVRFSFDFTPSSNQADWIIAANIVSTGNTDDGCIYIERTGSAVNIKKRPSAGVEQTFSTTAAAAAASENWDVRIKRTEIQIYRSGALVGRFSHRQTCGNGSVQFGLNTGSATNIVCDLENQPQVFDTNISTDDELLGVTQGVWQSGDFSVGGNAINHPSRLGVSRVFDAVIRQFINELPLSAPASGSGGSGTTFTGGAINGSDVTFGVGIDIITATEGLNNVRVGADAGINIVNGGDSNTIVGNDAAKNLQSGDDNVAVGFGALKSQQNSNANTAVGKEAMFLNSTGLNNCAVGFKASYANTTGHNNLSFGHAALRFNSAGSNNAGLGGQALFQNLTGSNNVGIGLQAGYAAQTSNYNTSIGVKALKASSGADNTGIGGEAGLALVSGTKNCFIGRLSGSLITSANKNTIIGSFSGNQGGLDIRTSSNNVVLSDGDGNPRLSVNSSGTTTIRGDLNVSGAVNKTGGTFKIDHPLPEKADTHHLVHSFTESPQADLLYSGTSDLVNGAAEINLDEYHGMTEGTFVALNRNIRVFTTNETDWEPIKGAVTGNILSISCQDASCSDTVSWLVIGERHDETIKSLDFTDEHGRVIVEPLKPT